MGPPRPATGRSIPSAGCGWRPTSPTSTSTTASAITSAVRLSHRLDDQHDLVAVGVVRSELLFGRSVVGVPVAVGVRPDRAEQRRWILDPFVQGQHPRVLLIDADEVARSATSDDLHHALPGSSGRRCCMNTLWGWGGLARTSRDPPQDPHYRDAVEGPSHV